MLLFLPQEKKNNPLTLGVQFVKINVHTTDEVVTVTVYR